MAMRQQDIMADLAYAEAEGPADMWEDESDLFADGYEDDSYEDAGDFFGEDEADWYEDEMEADEADESIGRALGSILGAEDEDEFFGKLFSAAKNIIKKAAPVVGKIARGAAPILSMIPHPAAQIGSKVAGVLGKLKAEGGSVEDALEAVAEVAVRDRRALPIVAGLAARSVVKNKGAAMPPAQRQQVARTMTNAAKNLVASGGPTAIRALPKITKSVKRTAAARGTPVNVRPKAVARTAAKVAQNPPLLRRLSAPSPRGQAIVARSPGGMVGGTNGGTRNISVPGPATITISVG
jgi:hypothetical protein